MKKNIIVLFLSALTISGCAIHFHNRTAEILLSNGLECERISKYEDWSYTADTVLMRNVIFQFYTADIDKRCFSHIIVDSILHSVGNPKSTVLFRQNSMAEYEKKKGLFFVDIPKFESRRVFFRSVDYYYFFTEIPILYVNDSCWFINTSNKQMDSTLQLGIRQKLLNDFDSSYIEGIINRYGEGAKSQHISPYSNSSYFLK